MNAPFNTLKNKGLVPSKSRLISLATRATSFKIRSSGMKGTYIKVLNDYVFTELERIEKERM